MKDLPLTLLRALAATYDVGGVRAAGRALGVTHSAISRHLRELEQWLGMPLLEGGPTRRAFRLTPEGEILARKALESFSMLDQAVATAREGKRPNSVSVSTTPSFAVRWLLPRLPDFEQAHPWIEVSILIEQRRRAPAEEGADLAIRMGGGPWSDGECTVLMDDRVIPVAGPAYMEEAGLDPSSTDMTGLRLLHDRDPGTAWSKWKKAFGPDHLDIRSGPRFTSSDVVMRAAEQGMGVVLARARLCEDAFRTGALVPLGGGASVRLPQAHWIVRDPTVRSRQACDVFVAWLTEEARRSLSTA